MKTPIIKRNSNPIINVLFNLLALLILICVLWFSINLINSFINRDNFFVDYAASIERQSIQKLKDKDKGFLRKVKFLLDVKFDDNRICSDTAVKLIKLNFEPIPSENILDSNEKLHQWLTMNEDSFEFIEQDGTIKVHLRKN